MCRKWLLLLCLLCLGASVRVAWDANSEPDLAGYRLRAFEGTNTTVIDVGLVTTFEITNLVVGKLYRLNLTAYNTAGAESEPSNTIVYSPTNEEMAAVIGFLVLTNRYQP